MPLDLIKILKAIKFRKPHWMSCFLNSQRNKISVFCIPLSKLHFFFFFFFPTVFFFLAKPFFLLFWRLKIVLRIWILSLLFPGLLHENIQLLLPCEHPRNLQDMHNPVFILAVVFTAWTEHHRLGLMSAPLYPQRLQKLQVTSSGLPWISLG